MIPVKVAVEKATAAINECFANSKPRLEEVIRSGQDDTWQITLSFLREVEPNELSGTSLLMGGRYRREFKTVVLDGTSGDVLSIKIRELQGHASIAE